MADRYGADRGLGSVDDEEEGEGDEVVCRLESAGGNNRVQTWFGNEAEASLRPHLNNYLTR